MSNIAKNSNYYYYSQGKKFETAFYSKQYMYLFSKMKKNILKNKEKNLIMFLFNCDN